MARILISADLPGPALGLLRAEHEIEVGPVPTGLGQGRILERIANFDALISIVTDRIDAAVIDAGARLRVVANCGVGVDNIDREACRERGIVVTNTPDVLTDATADLTFGLVLAAARRIAEGDRTVRAGRWPGFSPTELLGARVSGATIGIIGFGRIGRAVARRAQGFAMTTLYTQRSRAPEDVERALGARRVELDELLAASDFVCLCCPLTDETRGLLSRERIGRMKPSAVLVNTARGACLDEIALAEALSEGRIAAAGLDVYAAEPKVPEALLACERAVLLPHIGSADAPTREAMARLSAESVLDVLAGREPKHRVV
jgi:glyoxylate reductase